MVVDHVFRGFLKDHEADKVDPKLQDITERLERIERALRERIARMSFNRSCSSERVTSRAHVSPSDREADPPNGADLY